ncbi:hypothetical protein DFA_07106 [Cavenderia fasciculata]|uniref:Uncharacterized protein n=1 Tax=Cavenderia fasciculata TaxID=261658 RepID=F4PVH7_CACFS|nr:uncharacterized protein DFA_07106 [Cavenderia fasciculata]EGG19991.1 hypothetical protein DFA_07106 [Cavenderia fasciculata]|eukprot:XP_004366974.1 hypothetical protein DFA_07106 [Cavenderia fasciculata]
MDQQLTTPVPQQQQQQQDINIKDLLNKIENVALKNTKSKECLDLLKLLYRITINYYKTNNNNSSSSSGKKNHHNKKRNHHHQQQQQSIILPNALKANPVFIEKLTTVLIDPNSPLRVKTLSLSIISKISTNEPQLLHKNLKTFFNDHKVLSLLLSLMITSGSGNASLFIGTIPFIAQSILEPLLRSSSLPFLSTFVRHYSDSIPMSQIKPIESQLGQFLSHASLVSDQKQSNTGFFKIGQQGAAPVTEMDGSISIEFFTVLNNSQVYTEDQSFNIYSFSMLYVWLTNLYNPQKQQQQQQSQQQQIGGETPPQTPREIGSALSNRVLNPNFQSIIVSYCLRIIDQSKLRPIQDEKSGGAIDNIAVIALLESIRILDFLCCMDINLVPKIFPTVQKAYQLHIPSSRNTNANSGHVLLALLQFFVNHSHTLIYDPEPLFRAYFQTFLPKTYMNSFVSFETLNFCLKNKEKLLENSNVFGLYFPPIFKCLAWFPHSLIGEFSELLPSLISPNTFIEVFHLLLDLPLLTSSMESVLVEQRKYATMGGIDINDLNDTAWSEYRVLYNYLLRNESGVSINFWSTTTLPLLQQFCRKTPVTPRTIGSCELVPALLHIYFDILLAYGDKTIFRSLLPVVFERVEQMFPFEPYQRSVKQTLITEIMSIFNQYPSLVVDEKDLLVQIITEGRGGGIDMTQCLCWIIGEYSSASICTEITPTIFNDYHEALELIAYERINMMKMESLSSVSNSSLNQQSQQQQQQPQQEQQSSILLLGQPHQQHQHISEQVTLMLVIISSLTKLAARWPEATSRVILCLLKVQSYHQYFDPQVIQRSIECVQLLQFPSFSSALYDYNRYHYNNINNNETSTGSLSYINSISHDNHSSLSFLLIDGNK